MKVRPFARQRPLVCCAVLFGVGIWIGMQEILPLGILLGGLLLSVCCGVALHLLHGSRLYAVLAAVFFLGACYVSVLNAVPLPESGTYRMTAYITGDVEVRDDGFVQAYVKDLEGVDERGNRFHLERGYWCMTADDAGELALAKLLFDGDRISFQGKLYEPLGQMNPYGFDFRAYLRQQNVRMVASGNADLRVTKEARLDAMGMLYRVRHWLGGKMEQIFGEGAVYPKTLLLGDRSDLPDETRSVFANLGIAHILAVSGLHVGLIVAGLMGMCRPLHLTPKQKWVLLAVFLVLYAGMLSFSAPVVRAGILILLTYGRRVLRRSQDPLTFLATAFGIILCAEPFSLTSVSFQMTFAAVAGMVLLGEQLSARLSKWPSWMRPKELAVFFSASLGVLIPMVNNYHRISLVSVVVNPVASVLIVFLLPAYALITLVGCICMPVGHGLAHLLHGVLGGLMSLMEKMANWSFATVRVPEIPWMLAAGLVLIVLLSTRYVVMSRRVRLLSMAAVLFVSVGIWQLTMVRDVWYIQLYAGQADCAVIADRDETVVIDTGSNGRDLSSYLLSTGRNADTLILTHLHSDHAGGVKQLLEDGIEIKRVLIPQNAALEQVDEEGLLALDLLREAGVAMDEVAAGDQLVLKSGTMDFIWPVHARTGQDANQYSLVSLIELEGVRILSTGDITGAYEKYVAQPADILKVSHHGSASGTGEAFLENVSPQIALISCAKDRALPADETLLRLDSAGAQTIRTDEAGAITIRIRNGMYAVDTFIDSIK